jgi:hypothetical protein
LTGPGQFVFTFLFSAFSYHVFMESPEPPAKFRDWVIFIGLTVVALSVIFFHVRGWRYERHIKRHIIEKVFQTALLISSVLYLTAFTYHIIQIS